MNPEAPRGLTEAEKARALHEKTLGDEKKYSNPGTFPFQWIDAARKTKTGLSQEEIALDDARKINELKNKLGMLTDKEKQILEQRESSDLFMDVFEERDTQARQFERTSPFEMPEGRIYKEAFYPVYQIKGVLNGKEILLKKFVYPADTEELRQELFKQDPFYMRDWKGPTVGFYEGWVDDQSLPADEAEKLFKEYQEVAKNRSEEIRNLKAEKETEKYGHPIKGAYEYRVATGPDDFSNLNSDSKENGPGEV